MLWEPRVKIKQHILVQLLCLKDVVVFWQGTYLLPPSLLHHGLKWFWKNHRMVHCTD